LTDATVRARQLAVETDDLKKKTRVFHQRLSLMLETQLEQVKSEEWNEILKPFSSYVSDSHTIIKEVLSQELNTEKAIDVEVKVEETKKDNETKPEAKSIIEGTTIDPKAMLDLLNKEDNSEEKE